MQRALELAERGRATVRPNPLVGCVVVRDGQVVGEGWHERAGGPHAEVVALQEAGSAATGATMYVTLEPCAHAGRTGPCTAAMIDAGVSRVVFGAADQRHGGSDELREAGVEVTGGVNDAEAAAQNEVFFHARATGRPHVTLKIAQSLDGRVAAADGSSRWITSQQSRTEGHRLRAAVDAVLVGVGTVLADDPALTVRHVSAPLGQPRAVVLDTGARTPTSARLSRPGTIVVTGPGADDERTGALRDAGVDVVTVERGETGVRLDAALRVLHDRGVRSVLAEGGPRVAGSLLDAGLVQRLVAFVAPCVLGADGRASVAGRGPATLDERWTLEFDAVSRVGPDIRLEARPAAPADGVAPAATTPETG